MSSIQVSGVTAASLTLGASGVSGAGFSRPPGKPPAEVQERFKASFSQAAQDLGIDSSRFAELGGKIQDALSNLDLSSSKDPRTAIESTIDSTLKENGVDADKFKADFQRVLDHAGESLPGGAQGFGGSGPGAQAATGTYDASSQIKSLLDALSKGDDENSTGAKVARSLQSARSGSFVNTAA